MLSIPGLNFVLLAFVFLAALSFAALHLSSPGGVSDGRGISI